jgi:dipeptidyl-peptidase-4
MNETSSVNTAIEHFPRSKARTLRFTCGAPRSAQVIGDGSRALFLRSDGPEDLVTALWLSWFDADGGHHETKLADPRELLGAAADGEHVPAEEKARRERAREGGAGIVGYSSDVEGDRVVFTINGRLFLTEIGDSHGDPDAGSSRCACSSSSVGGERACASAEATGHADSAACADFAVRTRELAGAWLDEEPDMYTPVLNPRISPDGEHVLYTTGTYMMLVDIGEEPQPGDSLAEEPQPGEPQSEEPLSDRITPVYGVSVEDEDGNPAENTWKIGLAEFVAGEEMDRYDGFWWAPDSRHILMESFDTADEPTWYISDPADPEVAASGRRYPRALTRNADVYLTLVTLAFDGENRYAGITANAEVQWDREEYEYVAAVQWREHHDPLVLVQNRRQSRDQVLSLAVHAAEEGEAGNKAGSEAARMAGREAAHQTVHCAEQVGDVAENVVYEAVRQAGSEAGSAAGSAALHRAEHETDVTAPAPALGETRVLEEHANEQWIDLVAGTPAFTPDGRLICACNDMDADTNRLTVDGHPFTPEGWNVRTVLDVTDCDVLAVVQRAPERAPEVPAAWVESAADHDARSFDVVSFGYDGTVTPITDEPGVWTASRGTCGMVVSGRDMAHCRATMRHILLPAAPASLSASVSSATSASPSSPAASASSAASASLAPSFPADPAAAAPAHVPTAPDASPRQGRSASIVNQSAEPGFAPNVRFARLGEHLLYTAIIAPSQHSPYANASMLPVLMKPYGGPGFQQVVASQSFYWEAQWWADQGFLVVTADGRGTTGRGPAWDRAIFERMKDVTLADQIEAVHALPAAIAELGDIPSPDLDKVCMIGWSYGGFLSALAVLDAPDVFKAACAGAPPTDWTLYDTHYTERYLGLDPETYQRNGIIPDAPKLVRPLMLIHGFADDNVTIAHSLRLSQALMAAGRPHTFLPLTGITHMTNDETVAENLLLLQRDFLRNALSQNALV